MIAGRQSLSRRQERGIGETRFDKVPSSMHRGEIVQCRYLAQAVISHPLAVAASMTLQLSDRTSVVNQFSLVDGPF